jgi:hypothetical protein
MEVMSRDLDKTKGALEQGDMQGMDIGKRIIRRKRKNSG